MSEEARISVSEMMLALRESARRHRLRSPRRTPRVVAEAVGSDDSVVAQLVRAVVGIDADLSIVFLADERSVERLEAIARAHDLQNLTSVTTSPVLRERLREIALADLFVQMNDIASTREAGGVAAALGLGTPVIFTDGRLCADAEIGPSWLVAHDTDGSSNALSATLREAVAEIKGLRIPDLLADEVRQDQRTHERLAAYERELDEGEPGEP